MPMPWRLAGFLFLTAALALSAWAEGQSTQGNGNSSAPSSPSAPASDVLNDSPAVVPTAPARLSSGDLVDVSVYNVPDLSTRTRVGNNGDIYLPLVSYVHVAGLTTEEAQQAIEKRLADGGFVKDPHVSLLISDYTSQGANVLGSVNKPGVYPVVGDHLLLDLISAAGGFAPDAGRTVSVTHRTPSSQPVTVVLARNVVNSGDSNIPVSPGDLIYVHRADVIYVVGDVAKPSGIYVDRDDLTVLQALALAGGPTHDAKLNGARIVRRGANGATETPLELKKILEAKSPDVKLAPNDILFVPSRSGFFNAARNGASLALQATTTVTYLTVVR